MKRPKVAVIMGSKSDLPIMVKATIQLKKFGIAYEVMVASAHRTPMKVMALSKKADKNYDLIIAGAGGAAHLPGVIAAYTPLPVIGVPIKTKALKGLDSMASILQMPSGVPVATVAIDGARNAAILAAEILGVKYPGIRKKVKNLKVQLAKERR